MALADDEAVRAAAFHTGWLEHVARGECRKAEVTGGEATTMQNRYSFGGDEHVFVEVDEAMSLEAFFKSLSITNAVRDAQIKGVTEICPANASFQIKFDPDVIAPDDMLAELKRLEVAAEKAESQDQDTDRRDAGPLPRSRGPPRR